MGPGNESSESESDGVHEHVVRILAMKKSRSRRAELTIGAMCEYEDIVARTQDAGRDKPFDLRAPDDGIRIDVKTQRNGELNVKREKYGKQFLAWEAAGERFLPVQVVVDSKTKGWYVVPGIPTAAKTPLDPLDTEFDPRDPGKPFCIGQCLLEDLESRERFEAMRAKLNKGLKDVKENGEPIKTKVSKEYQSYIAEVAQRVLEDGAMHTAVINSIAGSEKAMAKLAQSDEAMAKLAQSDEAMAKLAQSDEAMAKLAQSDEAMKKILGPEMFQAWKERLAKQTEG